LLTILNHGGTGNLIQPADRSHVPVDFVPVDFDFHGHILSRATWSIFSGPTPKASGAYRSTFNDPRFKKVEDDCSHQMFIATVMGVSITGAWRSMDLLESSRCEQVSIPQLVRGVCHAIRQGYGTGHRHAETDGCRVG
jgi:hypothetical protein